MIRSSNRADRRRAVRREAILLGILALVGAGVSKHFGLSDVLLNWLTLLGWWQIDFVFGTFVTLTLVFALVARYQEGARSEAEARLRTSEKRLAKIVTGNPCAIFVATRLDGRIVEANAEFERLTGHSRTEVLGRTTGDLGLWGAPDFEASIPQLLARDGSLRNIETTIRRRNEEQRTVLFSADTLDDQGEAMLLVTLSDISERKHLEDQLAYHAFHDPLTKLANRALFKDRVQQGLARAKQQGLKPAVLFLDLDDFKAVNDSLGHATGDALLRGVASRVLSCLRGVDTCARFGGDEFAILLDDVGTDEAAAIVAERILGGLRRPFSVGGHEVFVTASIGIAIATDLIADEELLRDADLAMYLAKSNGKGRIAFYKPEMYEAARQRFQIENELRAAVDRGELVLHYQPIVELATERIVGLEALVRWQHPTRGCIPPGEFIPIAEATGEIINLGRWILHQACRQAVQLQKELELDWQLRITVNVSGRQIAHDVIVDDVKNALRESGLAPSNLILEITEGVLVRKNEETIARLWELKRLGVLLAIDDFGTGYSSLAYLQRFPVDILKIDKSFTDRLAAGVEESPLSRAVVALGSTLNLQTIAEGIETGSQQTSLRALGCSHGQGFLLGRPVPAAEILTTLQTRHGAVVGVAS